MNRPTTPPPVYDEQVPHKLLSTWASPERVDCLRSTLMVLIAALCVRMVGAIILGEGAPFGPDGTGAQAAVFLGGHPYPLHTEFLRPFGADARALSMFCGALNCVLLWHWGRAVGLGGAGGWLAVTMPLSVLPGVLASGDAPALTVALAGVLLSTRGGLIKVIGGAVAACSVAVKPIALPALVLLAVHPMSLLGATGTLIALRSFVQPLWAPMASGGILGTWWISTDGTPPELWMSWWAEGAMRLASTEFWGLVPILLIAALTGLFGATTHRLRRASLGPLAAATVIAALFGGRLELRYLSAAFVVALPFLSPLLSRGRSLLVLTLLALWPTAAVITQLAAERAEQDPQAILPTIPTVHWPEVDAGPLFAACSTEGATRLRNLAFQLAEVAPEGSTIITSPRPDGREGELFWPLRVLRPDLKVAVR
jgi:hypothetical protein